RYTTPRAERVARQRATVACARTSVALPLPVVDKVVEGRAEEDPRCDAGDDLQRLPSPVPVLWRSAGLGFGVGVGAGPAIGRVVGHVALASGTAAVARGAAGR